MKKKGISLILLVITIIIIIIIASAVILNLNNNNPVDKARLANVQSTRDSLKSGINLYIGKIMVKENGNHNASTMILGKNTQVIDYSIIHDYSMYETIRENLNIWQLDYTAIQEKVNIKLDIYDNNSRWYIDEWGNPFLVYNSLENVSPYLKTEDSSAILSSVQDFVVVLDNVEFAENSTLGKANTYKSSITSAVKRYLGANSSLLNEIADSSSVNITVNGVDTNLYKLNISNLNTKAGTNLTDTYESADWYIDENGNTYLIYDNESNIPEEMKGGVSTNSYVTINGGTITGYVASNNSSSSESGNGNNNQGTSEQGNTQKEAGSITLSSTKGVLTYGNSLDITVTNPNSTEITAISSDETIVSNQNIVITNNNTQEVTISLTALSKAGNATITITGAEDATHNAVTKTYSLTVWSGEGNMPVSVAKATINSSNIAEYIGTAVDYHPSGDTAGVYRIFYLDTEGKYGDGENTLYLKRDLDSNLIYTAAQSNYNLQTYIKYYGEYSEEDMGKFNQKWQARDGQVNDPSEVKAAYLCTKKSWEKYADSSLGAKYAIGSPSLEMFIDAYHQYVGSSNVLDCSYVLVGETTYEYSTKKTAKIAGYNVYPYSNQYYSRFTSNNVISSGRNNIFSGSSNYLLSTNSAGLSSDDNEALILISNYDYNRIDYANTGNRICPVVCLGN